MVLAAAGVAAAYVVFTTPPLRRLVRQGAFAWLDGSVPEYLLRETARAWVESGRHA